MDATYKTNKLGMALTTFTGINNEGRNIILGYALLKRESMESYQWLLKTFTQLNDGIEPSVILTDYDASMCGAIEKVYTETTHLLC